MRRLILTLHIAACEFSIIINLRTDTKIHDHRPEDLAVLVFIYKRTRELARRLASFRGEFVEGHPQYPPGSAAAAGLQTTPVPINAPDITYTPEDDRAIETWVKKIVSSTWHSVS